MSLRRGALKTTLALAALVGIASVSSCIIAEPPNDPPALPLTRPTIVRGSVVPPASSVLGRFPDKFIVPVELFDPTVSFEWAAWIDFNPATGEGLEFFDVSEFTEANTIGRVRTLEVLLRAPAEDRCHVIEVVVGLRLQGNQGLGAHAPAEPGGDIVTWYYAPNGDMGSCPVLDAGLDASPLDAEAGADGDGGVN